MFNLHTQVLIVNNVFDLTQGRIFEGMSREYMRHPVY